MTERKRPVLVWVISIFYVVSAAFTALSFYLVYSGSIPLQPQQAQYFDALTTFDWFSTLLIGVINFSAALLLFLMRKQAAYLFPSGFALGLAVTIWHTLTKGWLAALGDAGLVGAMIGWGISIAVCVYCWRLLQRGALA